MLAGPFGEWGRGAPLCVFPPPGLPVPYPTVVLLEPLDPPSWPEPLVPHHFLLLFVVWGCGAPLRVFPPPGLLEPYLAFSAFSSSAVIQASKVRPL